MTPIQIASLVAVAAVAIYFYLPALPRKPNSLRQVQAVLEIRDSATTPEVRKACSTLLQALLQ